jgi:choline dehydrogenase
VATSIRCDEGAKAEGARRASDLLTDSKTAAATRSQGTNGRGRRPDLVADYVIIGGGAAGCVLAARLSEDPHTEVLLLEEGAFDHRWDPFLHMPAGFTWNYNRSLRCAQLQTEPQAALHGRRVRWPMGRVLGGGTSVNGLVYQRGHPMDYENWANETSFETWNHAGVLPYFERLERFSGETDGRRGRDGPFRVTQFRTDGELARAFVQAGIEAGHREVVDFNGAHQEGVGGFDATIWKGRRISASTAYLRPAAHRPNLRILTRATAARLVVDGTRCTGAEVRHRGRDLFVHARGETLLSGGALGSPHLLMRSGIGPRQVLSAAGIGTRHHLPGVGRNLRDHAQLSVVHGCRQAIASTPTSSVQRLLIGFRWLTTRGGMGATNHMEHGAFLRSSPAEAWPDLQLHFIARGLIDTPDSVPGHGYFATVGIQRPRSRGEVRLRSDRLDEPPIIDPRYLDDPHDLETFVRGVELAREIFAQKAFAPYEAGEAMPGPTVRTRREIEEFVRAHARTSHHPAGTCRMGRDDDAVVDETLKVIGLEALRVIDSSVMPQVINGNTMAPSLMIGEKGADLVRGLKAPATARGRPQPLKAAQSPA